MGDDHVDHPVDQGHIRPRLLLEPEMGKVDEVDPPRIGHDELGPSLPDRRLHLQGNDRMVFRGVGADDEDTVRVPDLSDGVGHGSASKCHRQTGDGGAVSETGAVVDVVRAEGRAGHLLQEVVLLVRALGRDQDADGIGPVLRLHLLEALPPPRPGPRPRRPGETSRSL